MVVACPPLGDPACLVVCSARRLTGVRRRPAASHLCHTDTPGNSPCPPVITESTATTPKLKSNFVRKVILIFLYFRVLVDASYFPLNLAICVLNLGNIVYMYYSKIRKINFTALKLYSFSERYLPKWQSLHACKCRIVKVTHSTIPVVPLLFILT